MALDTDRYYDGGIVAEPRPERCPEDDPRFEEYYEEFRLMMADQRSERLNTALVGIVRTQGAA